MSTTDRLVVGNDRWRVGILPAVGASLAFGQISDDEGWVDLLRPTPPEADSASECSSFVLAPWSNRIAGGVLRFEGRTWQLRPNEGMRTAIHGTARDFAWRVLSYDGASCMLEFDSSAVIGANFPWQFLARVCYTVSGADFVITTTLKNYDTQAFPAGFGHHPYFMRTLAGSTDEVRLQIPCSQSFRLRHKLPEGPPTAIEERIDFRSMRPLGNEVIDDCLTGRDATSPIRFLYPRSHREIDILADELYQHVVLYAPQGGKPYFALEPVTNANDGFTLYERGVPSNGIFVLEPNEERTAHIVLRQL